MSDDTVQVLRDKLDAVRSLLATTGPGRTQQYKSVTGSALPASRNPYACGPCRRGVHGACNNSRCECLQTYPDQHFTRIDYIEVSLVLAILDDNKEKDTRDDQH